MIVLPSLNVSFSNRNKVNEGSSVSSSRKNSQSVSQMARQQQETINRLNEQLKLKNQQDVANFKRKQDSSRMSVIPSTIQADPYRTPDIKNVRNHRKYVKSRDSNDSRRSYSERKTPNMMIKTQKKPVQQPQISIEPNAHIELPPEIINQKLEPKKRPS